MSHVHAASGPLIEVILVGGPADLPAEQRVRTVAPDVDKVKVLHGGGHEHFERAVLGTEDYPVVFRWTCRTRIAE